MRQVCKYDVERDIMQVDITGYVDLVKANRMSSIDVPMAIVEERFNDIDDPRSIGTRPSDIFEEMQANKAIVDYKAPDGGTSE